MGSDEARGRDRYGRRRGSRYQLSEDEGSASSDLSEGMVDDTLARHDGTDNDALPLRKGGTGWRPRRPPPPGTGSLRLEELKPSGPAHRGHDDGSTLQPGPPPPPALPPMFQGARTEAHWQKIPADVRNCLGLPLGAGSIRDRVVSDVARESSLRQEYADRANNEALATAEAARSRAISSCAATERRWRAAAEERASVMQQWEEADRARAAEAAVAARESQEAYAAIMRAEKVLAEPGD